MKEIPLTRGYVAIVDDEEFDALSQYKWAVRTAPHTQYAFRSNKAGKPINMLMHRQIMQPPEGMIIDHLNGNGLDNRRENLRICTLSENNQNYKVHREGKLPGVARMMVGDKEFWRATAWNGKKMVHVGFGSNKEEVYQMFVDFKEKLKESTLEGKE